MQKVFQKNGKIKKNPKKYLTIKENGDIIIEKFGKNFG